MEEIKKTKSMTKDEIINKLLNLIIITSLIFSILVVFFNIQINYIKDKQIEERNQMINILLNKDSINIKDTVFIYLPKDTIFISNKIKINLIEEFDY